MGAQTDDRLTQYKKRYKDWEDPNGKTLTVRSADYIYKVWSQDLVTCPVMLFPHVMWHGFILQQNDPHNCHSTICAVTLT